MALINEFVNRRKISSLDIHTPLLIPSYSSKAIPFIELESIWAYSKDHLFDVALISSYDLYYEEIDAKIDETPILFLDSGGYEGRIEYDLSETKFPEYQPKEWNKDFHFKAIEKLKTASELVLVSYDEIHSELDTTTQISNAKEFFSAYKNIATDFLLKPEGTQFLHLGAIEKNIESLVDFDIIGVTEKELGASFLERLDMVLSIRKLLNEIGEDKPIHVFGSLNPYTLAMFYLCGADIFDGLSWLRFGYLNQGVMYLQDWGVLKEYFELDEIELRVISWINNLEELSETRRRLIEFVDGYNLEILPQGAKITQRMLDKLGLEI